MIQFVAILLLSIVAVDARATSVWEKQIRRICDENTTCCLHSIRQNLSINCSLELQDNVFFAKEIEKVMHPEQEQLAEHFDCCRAFRNNFSNDPNNKCYSDCTANMLTPSLSKDHRILNIKSCLQTNTIFRCFEECIASKNFDFQCGKIQKMPENEVLVNLQSRRRG